MREIQDIQKALESPDEEIRREALQTLRARPLSEIRPLVFAGMADDSWRVRKEAVDLFVSANPDEVSVTELLEQLRNGDNAGLRNSAAEALARLGTRAAAPLLRLASDDDADVRKFIIDVMGAIGSPLFLPTLLSALEDGDVNVAAAAAEHLGDVGDSEAVPRLIESIIRNESVFYRFSALAALGKLSSHTPVPPEIMALAEQDFLRTGVYECLGSIGDKTAIPILLQGLVSRQKSSRKAAITSLYRIYSRSASGDRQALESMLRHHDDAVMKALIDAFDADETQLAEAVITLLGLVGDPRGAATLLEGFSNERLTGTALAALKRWGDSGLLAMIELYPQADEPGRSAICSIIDLLAFSGGADLIRQALHDPSDPVRKAAVSAAGKLGLTDAIPAIVSLLEEGSQEVRSGAVSCLQVLALIDREAIKRVADELVASYDPGQRRNAAILHATLGDGDSLSLLIKDEDPGVRQAAVSSIGKLRLGSHAGILLIALVDEDPDVRIAAAEALGETGGAGTVDALLPALDDEDCWVQSAVLKSVGRLDPGRVLPVIKSLFPSADGLLMVTCLELLGTIGGSEAVDLIESALESRDDDICRLAVSLLGRQDQDWLESNAERLLAHPREQIRNLWAPVVGSLPQSKAIEFLTQALSREQSPLVNDRIVAVLERIR